MVPGDLLKLRPAYVAAAWPAVAAIVLVVLTWQTTSLTATAGLDPSWIAGLHLAHANGVGFGPHFVWTYGPLGFLAFPVAVTGATLAGAFVFVLVAQLVFAYLLVRRAATAFAAPLAIVLAYVVLALPIAHADLLLLIVFLYALWAFDDPLTLPARAFPVVAGVLAGIAALLKTNTGAAAVGIAIVASWALAPAGRRWLAVLPSLVVTFCVLWVATGNSLLDIPGWLRLSASIVGGYSAAMQDEQLGLRWEYLVAGILVALLAAVVVRHTRALPRERRIATLLITLGFAFTYFKEGFVRHDVDHSPYFFAAMAVAFVAFAWDARARWAAVAGVAIAIGAVAVSIGLHYAPIASARHVAPAARRRRELDEAPSARLRLARSRAAHVRRAAAAPAPARREDGRRRSRRDGCDRRLRPALAAVTGPAVLQRLHRHARRAKRARARIGRRARADPAAEHAGRGERAEPRARGARDLPRAPLQRRPRSASARYGRCSRMRLLAAAPSGHWAS